MRLSAWQKGAFGLLLLPPLALSSGLCPDVELASVERISGTDVRMRFDVTGILGNREVYEFTDEDGMAGLMALHRMMFMRVHGMMYGRTGKRTRWSTLRKRRVADWDKLRGAFDYHLGRLERTYRSALEENRDRFGSGFKDDMEDRIKSIKNVRKSLKLEKYRRGGYKSKEKPTYEEYGKLGDFILKNLGNHYYDMEEIDGDQVFVDSVNLSSYGYDQEHPVVAALGGGGRRGSRLRFPPSSLYGICKYDFGGDLVGFARDSVAPRGSGGKTPRSGGNAGRSRRAGGR